MFDNALQLPESWVCYAEPQNPTLTDVSESEAWILIACYRCLFRSDDNEKRRQGCENHNTRRTSLQQNFWCFATCVIHRL